MLGLIVSAGLIVSSARSLSAAPKIGQVKEVAPRTAAAVSTTFVADFESAKVVSCAGAPEYFYNAVMTPEVPNSPLKFLCGYYLSPENSAAFPFNGGTISVTTSEAPSFPYGVQLSGPCSTGTCTVILTSSQTSAAIPVFTNSPTLAISSQSSKALKVTVTLSSQ
jgi:hypothetical protein